MDQSVADPSAAPAHEAPPSPVRHPPGRVVRDARGRRDVPRNLHGQRCLEWQLDVRHDHPRRRAGDLVQRDQHHARRQRQPDADGLEHGHRRAALRDDVDGRQHRRQGPPRPAEPHGPGRHLRRPRRHAVHAARSTAPRSATRPRAPTRATATSPPAAATACASAGASRSRPTTATRTPPPRRRSPSPRSRRPTTRSPSRPPTSRPAPHRAGRDFSHSALQTRRSATGHLLLEPVHAARRRRDASRAPDPRRPAAAAHRVRARDRGPGPGPARGHRRDDLRRRRSVDGADDPARLRGPRRARRGR